MGEGRPQTQKGSPGLRGKQEEMLEEETGKVCPLI